VSPRAQVCVIELAVSRRWFVLQVHYALLSCQSKTNGNYLEFVAAF
jgi:hypothetical protein